MSFVVVKEKENQDFFTTFTVASHTKKARAADVYYSRVYAIIAVGDPLRKKVPPSTRDEEQWVCAV